MKPSPIIYPPSSNEGSDDESGGIFSKFKEIIGLGPGEEEKMRKAMIKK